MNSGKVCKPLKVPEFASALGIGLWKAYEIVKFLEYGGFVIRDDSFLSVVSREKMTYDELEKLAEAVKKRIESEKEKKEVDN